MSEVPPASGPSSSSSSPSMTDVLALLAPNQQFMATLLAQQQIQSTQKTLEEPKDTRQYFLHRFMHVNKWFYKHFHSWHHRLYVPYAFGALYNHPLEGFALDSPGTEYLTGMTTPQALVLFTVSTFKTVDGHCDYKLPFDPLQLMSGNNADYHDIHHQQIGIKSNFARPFFIHWDVLLGTRMTREELELRRRKGKGEKASKNALE